MTKRKSPQQQLPQQQLQQAQQQQQQQAQQQQLQVNNKISPNPPGQPQQPTRRTSSEVQRQENLRHFNILLTPAFSAFSKILDGLFLTGVGGMSYNNFRLNKITNIINCTHEAPNWRLSGVECTRIPIDDIPEEILGPHLNIAVDKINEILSNGGRVVVHCVAGVSRSAAIVIAFLIKYRKMSLHLAYNHVQSCRCVVRPNNGFFRQLIDFESQVLGCSSVKMVQLKRDDVTIEVPDFFETEHKRFLLLETFKAKAAALKSNVLIGNVPTPVLSNVFAAKGAKKIPNVNSGQQKAFETNVNSSGQQAPSTSSSVNTFNQLDPSIDQPPPKP